MASGAQKVQPSTAQIPIVDVAGYFAGEERGTREAVEGLRYALENIGFFVLAGHGVDWAVVDRVYAQARRFFDLSPADKDAVALETHSDSGLMDARGYIGLESSRQYHTVRSKSLVESYNFDRDESGRNKWPANLDGFREGVLAYLAAVQNLAYRLLPLYARALDLPDDQYFAPFFEKPVLSLRLAHYPPQHMDGDGWGLIPHTDRAFMTLLPSNDVSGLQIKPENMGWIDAPNVPRTFVVNSGDILRRWSNHRFLSAPHRVLPPKQERYAVPFFYMPGHTEILEALPSCVTEDRPALYPPVSFEKFIRDFLKTDYVSQDARLQG